MGQAQSTSTFPQPGDHIYCRRKGGLYDHHGIYVGDNMVIHLQGKAKKLGAPSPCSNCGNKRVINGEIAKVCIDCEDFATYCKTGTAASNQISARVALLGAAAGPVGAIAGVAIYGISKSITAQRRR